MADEAAPIKKKKRVVPSGEDAAVAIIMEAPVKKKKAAAPAEPAKAVKPKVEKPVRQGLSTKDAAAVLSERLGRTITPVALRRTLRSDDFQNDHGYTSYDLTDEDVDRLEAALKSSTPGTRGRKPKAAESEADAPTELAELDEADDEVDELEDLESDEEEASEDDAEDLDADEDEDDDLEDEDE